jgi:hypothetical protein
VDAPFQATENPGTAVAVHHQDRDRDLLQILGEVGLRKGDDAVVVRLGAAHHCGPGRLERAGGGLGFPSDAMKTKSPHAVLPRIFRRSAMRRD